MLAMVRCCAWANDHSWKLSVVPDSSLRNTT
ncbi:Uncharacterised protein [Mycobacterium tuberculosis]|nr:Uncharacterised protein [Mycobacterium tuberculosis]